MTETRTIRDLLDAENVTLRLYREGEHRAACPRCALDKARRNDDALAVSIDDKGFQLKCHRCSWVAFGFYDAPAFATSPARPKPQPATRAAQDDGRNREWAFKIWKETIAIEGTIAEQYLRGRNINGSTPRALRFHARCWHTDLKCGLPSMIAPLIDIRSNEFCGIHRTYLQPNGAGKITDATARKMLGRSKGAVIKLTPDAKIEIGLCIAEGIETALSVMQAGYPIWATGSADGVKEFPALAGVECITVFSDPDPTGAAAAQACAERWTEAGREARILIPHGDRDEDWNDAIGRRAA